MQNVKESHSLHGADYQGFYLAKWEYLKELGESSLLAIMVLRCLILKGFHSNGPWRLQEVTFF